MADTRIVYGTLRTVDGQPQANALVTFTLRPFGVTPTSIYPQGGVSVLTDDNGNFNTALWRNSLSATPAQYRCTLPSGEFFDFILPGDSNAQISLSSLINLGVPSGSAQYAPVVDFIVTNPYLVGPPGGTPIALGKKRAIESVPVVLATDQEAIPVIEQQKVATEVSLSLLGIPRSETALGIFGDVNTYNVNETEWAFFPPRYTSVVVGSGRQGYGVRHEPTESAAYVSAPGATLAEQEAVGWSPKYSILTSKRFFRYQPGRVSSATFGVRMTVNGAISNPSFSYRASEPEVIKPDFKTDTHKKWGMFDNYNGYYFELVGTGGYNPSNPSSESPLEQDMKFWCVRRFTSVAPYPDTTTNEWGYAGKIAEDSEVKKFDMYIVRSNRRLVHAALFDATLRVPANDPNGIRLRRPTDSDMETNWGRHRAADSNTTYTFTDGSSITLRGLFGYDYDAGSPDIWVNKEYANVYEQRIPRRYFNGDPLNGSAKFYRYASDTYINDGISYSEGVWVKDIDGAPLSDSSQHNIDFTRVTMYKIEYSWYGAVGAQFFAYVPDENGGAKWVSIHHIRCSNQLTTPSLGNPTLPFRYVSYAGASQIRQDIVKYGTSYLIDGGDKGTVKINSATTDLPKTVYKSQVQITPTSVSGTNGSDLISGSVALLPNNWTFHRTVNASGSNKPYLPSFINSRLVVGTTYKFGTSVKNISPDYSKIYLGGVVSQYEPGTPITIIIGNGTPVLGIKLLEKIQNAEGRFARNRAQVYPTRLGAYTDVPCILRLIKNPEFGELELPLGFEYAQYAGAANPNLIRIKAIPFADLRKGFLNDPTLVQQAGFHFISGSVEESPIEIDPSTASLNTYFGTSVTKVFGSFAGVPGTLRRDGNYLYFSREKSGNDFNFTTVFGEKVNSSGTQFLDGTGNTLTQQAYDHYRTFIPAKSFLPNTGSLPAPSSLDYPRTSNFSGYVKYSAVQYDLQEDRAILPGTGTVIATFATGVGGNDFDLSPYFSYNKEYLSYPLVENGGADSLYLTAEPVSSTIGKVLATLTWEEQ